MQRNVLITLLAEQDNDTVTVSLNGSLVDICSVSRLHGTIVIILDPEGSRDLLQQLRADDLRLDNSHIATFRQQGNHRF